MPVAQYSLTIIERALFRGALLFMTAAETYFRSNLSDPLANMLTHITEGEHSSRSQGDGHQEAAALTLALCFEPTRHKDAPERVFGEALPHMLTHGLRQAVLAQTVLRTDEISAQLPSWFDEKAFLQGMVVADAGLVHISQEEVALVNRCGPKYAREYPSHPLRGYRMARQLSRLQTAPSQTVALLSARHHAVQARRAYGPSWKTLSRHSEPLVNPDHIDGMAALLKPFDFFDDFFGREGTGISVFERQAAEPHTRFAARYDELRTKYSALLTRLENDGFDPDLPLRVSELIVANVVHGGTITKMYQDARPDLRMDQAASAAQNSTVMV